jgi:CheY-like chemotaxis protein
MVPTGELGFPSFESRSQDTYAVQSPTGPSIQVDNGDLAKPSRPLSNGEREPGNPGVNSGGGWSGPGRILVVDDNPEIREYIAKLASREGFVVDTAGDGEEGWRSVCSMGYELVITDHQMPKLTGLSLIRRLREVSINAPCILISSSPPEPELAIAKLIDPGAVMTKPFKPRDLMETVYSLLRSGASPGTREAWESCENSIPIVWIGFE